MLMAEGLVCLARQHKSFFFCVFDGWAYNCCMETKLASEKVVVAAPMSFAGSAARIWKITTNDNVWLRWIVLIPAALILIFLAWSIVACWYVVFGLLLVPYRLIRRSSRKNKRDSLRHRELLSAAEEKRSRNL